MRKSWHWIFLLILFLPLAFCQTTPNHGPVPAYRIIALPFRPLSISNSRWLAGTTPDEKAAAWSAQTGLMRVPLPPEFTRSESLSINSKGEAVGYGSTADSSRRTAFLFLRGKVTLLPGEQSRAYSINDDGQIAGQARLPSEKSVGPVLWRNGSAISLNICCAGTARRINRQSLVVGDAYDKQGHYHAFEKVAAREAHLIAIPGAVEYSAALACNDRGQIILRAAPPARLFLDSEGKFDPIDIPNGDPRALNSDGTIVGSFGPNPEHQRAFIWDKGDGLRDLNSLIPQNSGWKLEVASSINDRGEIVGWGEQNGIGNTGFLLVPLRSRVRQGSRLIYQTH